MAVEQCSQLLYKMLIGRNIMYGGLGFVPALYGQSIGGISTTFGKAADFCNYVIFPGFRCVACNSLLAIEHVSSILFFVFFESFQGSYILTADGLFQQGQFVPKERTGVGDTGPKKIDITWDKLVENP